MSRDSVFREYAREKIHNMPDASKAKKPKEAPEPAAPEAKKEPPKAPPCYYDSARKTFWTRDSKGEWMELNESGIRRHLKKLGFTAALGEWETISPLESVMHRYQHEHNVHFSCALAGYGIGVHEICGNRVLVNRQRKAIEPKQGKWGLLSCVLEQLLGKQAIYFRGWIKAALESLQAGPPFRRGQALVMAGPSGCGKSFIQDVITELLGGRIAKPWEYLVGDTGFNQDLLESEHLVIEDEAPPGDLKTRRYFGAKLKNFVANTVQRLHPKGGKALSISPFWRISISLNDEPENLMCLPPLDESLKDKIILLKADRVKFPFASDDPEAQSKFRARISAELPAFLYDLRRWKIPEKLRDVRYGIRAAQNPELMHAVNSLAPEWKLLELIDDSEIWDYRSGTWEGTASQLERALRGSNRKEEVARLLTYNTACGVYLGRLAESEKERFSAKRVHGQVTRWTIIKRKE